MDCCWVGTTLWYRGSQRIQLLLVSSGRGVNWCLPVRPSASTGAQQQARSCCIRGIQFSSADGRALLQNLSVDIVMIYWALSETPHSIFPTINASNTTGIRSALVYVPRAVLTRLSISTGCFPARGPNQRRQPSTSLSTCVSLRRLTCGISELQKPKRPPSIVLPPSGWWQVQNVVICSFLHRGCPSIL